MDDNLIKRDQLGLVPHINSINLIKFCLFLGKIFVLYLDGQFLSGDVIVCFM